MKVISRQTKEHVQRHCGMTRTHRWTGQNLGKDVPPGTVRSAERSPFCTWESSPVPVPTPVSPFPGLSRLILKAIPTPTPRNNLKEPGCLVTAPGRPTHIPACERWAAQHTRHQKDLKINLAKLIEAQQFGRKIITFPSC